MKTLKKNLCLVLAMVMVFGLCTISASAKLEYADNDAITYDEAVDVLSGLGILSGSASGFRPTANITRAEAAKILAYVMIGNSEQADALKASAAPFTDVPVSHWAAGYIAYCNARGIILGVGDGSYRPNSNVTGLQFATMLLRALGYGTQKEYTGTDWSVKAASDAIRLGVFDDNLAGANATKYATREECALYAFNVIARERDGVCGLQKVTYSSLAGGYVANGAFGGGIGTNVDANKKNTFAADFGLDCVGAGADAFGREVGHHYTQKIGNSTKVITADYEEAGKQIALYTTGVTGNDLYNLIVNEFGKAVYDKWTSSNFELYHNSDDTTPSISAGSGEVAFSRSNIDKNVTKTLGGTGNGVQTYVYGELDAAGALHVRVCVIDTYLAKVDTVTNGTDTKDAKTVVTLANNTLESDSTNYHKSAGFETDEFAVDDYVLVTIADGDIQSMVPAIVKKGEITRYTNQGSKKITAGGVVYEAAKEQAVDSFANWTKADTIGANEVNGKEYNLYVDEYGYLIGVDVVTASSNYVYVAQFGHKYGNVDDLTDADGLTAHIYYADGTDKILFVHKESVLKTDDSTLSTPFSTADMDLYNKDTTDGAYNWGTNASKKFGATGIYVLEMKDGKAKLTTTAESVADGTNVQVGVTKLNVADSLKADAKTVFFYVHIGSGYGKSSYSVKAYTGIRNVPLCGSDDTAKTRFAISTSGKAEAVLVESSVAAESSDIVYLSNGKYVKEAVGDGKYSVTFRGYALEGADIGKVVDICTKVYDNEGDASNAASTKAEGYEKKFVKVDNGEPKPINATDPDNDKTWYCVEGEATVVNKISIKIANGKTGESASAENKLNVVYHGANATFVDLRDTNYNVSSINALEKLTGAKIAFVSDNKLQMSIVFVLDGTDPA